jgi:Uma2 family endonuclease
MAQRGDVMQAQIAEEPRVRKWTKDEYYQMADLGWFRDQRAELVEGDIVVLSPQKFQHGAVTDRTTQLLRDAMGERFWVRMQLPLDLGEVSEPEPDVSVVVGKREDYTAHPRSAALVVEVSDTTLAYDRGKKSSLYAKAGIAEYWIVDLVHGQLEVRRQPGAGGYTEARVLKRGETVSPLAMPEVRIEVAGILG